MAAIRINSAKIHELSIKLDERFVKGKSSILAYLRQEDGMSFSDHTIFTKTDVNHGAFVVAVFINGVRTFSLTIDAGLAELQAFISALNIASSMQCPFILKLNGEMLTATVYESMIRIDSAKIHELSIKLDERFVKGKSSILAYLRQKDGMPFSEYTIFTKTGVNHGAFTVAVFINGVRTFSLTIDAELAELQAFNSAINFASSMQCPIILKLDGEMLTATVYESKIPSNTPKVESFFKNCIGQ